MWGLLTFYLGIWAMKSHSPKIGFIFAGEPDNQIVRLLELPTLDKRFCTDQHFPNTMKSPSAIERACNYELAAQVRGGPSFEGCI